MKSNLLWLLGAGAVLWYLSKQSAAAPPANPNDTSTIGQGAFPVTCLTTEGIAYQIPMGPCPPGLALPPPGGGAMSYPPGLMYGGTSVGPQGLRVDSGGYGLDGYSSQSAWQDGTGWGQSGRI